MTEAIERLRRIEAGEEPPTVYGDAVKAWTGLSDDSIKLARAYLSFYDPTPLTEAVLREEFGFERAPSDMGPNYSDHYQRGKLEQRSIPPPLMQAARHNRLPIRRGEGPGLALAGRM
jgi:hypothetical protein